VCEYSAEKKRRAGEKRKVKKARESELVVIEHGGLQEAVSAKGNKLSG